MTRGPRPALAHLIIVVALVVLATSGGAANAQFFSPGPLGRPHASLEGLQKCSKCHQEQKGLSPKLCLDCHTELAGRVAKGAGFHGRLQPVKRDACQACHPDHRGLDFAMVDWDEEGGRDKFDHRRTGWALKGGHAKIHCDDCHQRRLIVDSSISRMLDKQPKRATYLGLGERCDSCHFDEHRGQLGRECQKCHNESAWKPPQGFNHQTTAFPLQGKHGDVPCAKCHQNLNDDHMAPNAFPKPRARSFMEMKPIEHKTCESCHDDPHKGSFGPLCSSCHVETGWKTIKVNKGQDASFHDKTRFPLRGGHVGVSCKSCHGPFPGQAAKFKGLAFGACSDCHEDAHLGQLRPKPPAKVAACDGCHTVNAFLPVRYELEQHQGTKFPLEGGHAATACRACHPIDDELATHIPTAVHKLLAARKRPERFSLALLHPKKSPEDCAACHEDVHRGQFANRAKTETSNNDKSNDKNNGATAANHARGNDCRACHQTTSFFDLTFDHDKDSRFPLTGKHAKTPCAGCHKVERAGTAADGVVRYKPLDVACGSCHTDAHQGQFLPVQVAGRATGREASGAGRRATRDCDFCHETGDFKKTSFDHDDKHFTSFPLDGKHEKVACSGCHPTIRIGDDLTTVRYRPVPRACEECHVDIHHGAFKGFEP